MLIVVVPSDPSASRWGVTDFHSLPPPFSVNQAEALAWMARIRDLDPRLVERVACPASQISRRFHSLAPLARQDADPRAFRAGGELHTLEQRMGVFASVADEALQVFYRNRSLPPHLVHVTCTGYLSPSAAQKIVGVSAADAVVTHAYHMGCYAAVPALRLAMGHGDTADVVHTELCSLHFDPEDRSPEQLVVQSLFADGLIRYRVQKGFDRGLEILRLREAIIPATAGKMSWVVQNGRFSMGLDKAVPEAIAGSVAGFVAKLTEGYDLNYAQYALHPGGPRIIDAVKKVLGLSEEQIAHSRKALFDRGNMSSATLPYIWQEMLASESIAEGTCIVSLAFGPGLTMVGALLRKR
jgi:predicted naringenin-chalcone synthase